MDESAGINDLNRRCGIAGVAAVVAGNGGLPMVRVTTSAATGEIYLHGAQVTAWNPTGGEEAIFLSERSHWEDGRAIRGGIPICFPWFRAKADDAQAPAHGFVRAKEWHLEAITADQEGGVMVACSTESDESSRKWWPHEFGLELRATFGKTLLLELTAKNTGASAFRFEEALHSYFRVGDARRVRVHGLDGVSFLDNTDGNRKKVQAGDVVFTTATDNAYLETAGALDLADPVVRRTIRTEKENSETTVVWNPWERGAAALADLGNDEWERMTCVEACNILGAAVTLEPGDEHTMRARIGIISA